MEGFVPLGRWSAYFSNAWFRVRSWHYSKWQGDWTQTSEMKNMSGELSCRSCISITNLWHISCSYFMCTLCMYSVYAMDDYATQSSILWRHSVMPCLFTGNWSSWASRNWWACVLCFRLVKIIYCFPPDIFHIFISDAWTGGHNFASACTSALHEVTQDYWQQFVLVGLGRCESHASRRVESWNFSIVWVSALSRLCLVSERAPKLAFLAVPIWRWKHLS